MKIKLLSSLILAALLVPGAALAASPFTANVGLTTDYLVRGISQTSGNPAVQGGVDFVHSSGLYVGVWGSNVSWITDFGATGSASLELDTYAGYRNSFAEDFSYDVGFIRYNYPGTYTPAANTVKADTNEVYGAIGYKWLTAKYSYALGDFLTVANARGTNYLELNASVPVADSGITFGAHYGKQTYRGPSVVGVTALTDPSYSDYKLSVARDWDGYLFTLAYSGTNAPKGGFYTTPAGKDLARGTAVLSVSHSF
ncbi:MAG TPA: TorF family putative porin [Gallionella sp.]|nr:TorF family putative porin [Gallionella sp.]